MRTVITFGALAIMAVALSGCAVISSQLSWFADGQTYAGEVHNFTGTPILGHAIDVRWFDSSGNLLRTDTTIGCLRSIPPGGSDFFESRAPAGGDVARVTAEVSQRVTAGQPADSGLTVRDVQAARDAGSLSIAVTLVNDGTQPVDSPRICVVVRNAAGNVVRMILLAGAAVMAPGYEQTTRATAGVQYNGDLSVEVWSDALLPHGLIAKPVRYGPVPLAAPARLTGIDSVDSIRASSAVVRRRLCGRTSRIRPSTARPA